ncbi:La-related protein 1C [Forsythia ovata]|uniref:La-related protein 1C n=1 Tax=Forsythia ovata TaxID=205694 RepID=A0ABD1PZ63_9LAMI
MTADSPTNDHSPRSPVTVVRGDSDLISSPTSAVSPPPIVVTAPEQPSASEKAPMDSSGPEAQPESSDVNSDGNAGRPRRHAWNTPVNGVVEPASVMGDAVSWPALSESTRPVPRSSSDTSRPVPDGSASSSQGPIISPPPQRQANTNAHVNSTANNMPARQRSRHRGGGAGGGSSSGSGPSSSAFSRPSPPPPPPPPFPVFDMPYGTMVPPMLDNPVRGTRPGGGVGGSQPHTGNDHSSPRNNSRRGGIKIAEMFIFPINMFLLPWGICHPQYPLALHQFISAPPPVRVFPGQMGFDMPSPYIYVPTLPPDSFRPMPIVPPPPPILFAAANDPLPNMIVKQIDYYFSEENLVKDNFLRSNMDDQGWVPITLIASFPRVQQLTYDVPLILDSLRNSTIVEVQGDKLRRRNEWKKWLPNGGWSNNDSGSQPPGASPEHVLATSLQNSSLDDATINANGSMDGQTEVSHVSDETTAMSKLANGEDTAEDVHNAVNCNGIFEYFTSD